MTIQAFAFFFKRKTTSPWIAFFVWLLCPVLGLAAAKPWMVDFAYGNEPIQKMDIYRPPGNGPFPVVMFIHAGGWWNGDKKWFMGDADLNHFLNSGIAVVSINYRFLPQAAHDGLFPPVLGPFGDARRAVQTIRYHSREWGIDASLIGVSGESAGATSALWLALSPDMANPASIDPVEKMSTRAKVVGVFGAQTSLDPRQMRDWVGPELAYGGHAYGLPEGNFEIFLKKRSDLEKYFSTLSPAALLGPQNPPIFLEYKSSLDEPKKDRMYYVHSPAFGIGFQKLAREKRAVCYLATKGHPAEGFQGGAFDFLIKTLRPGDRK